MWYVAKITIGRRTNRNGKRAVKIADNLSQIGGSRLIKCYSVFSLGSVLMIEVNTTQTRRLKGVHSNYILPVKQHLL